MESFKLTDNYGSHCNECGMATPGKASTVLQFQGVNYTLCDDCFKLFIGSLYLAKPKVFDDLISTLAVKDRQHMLSLINKGV